MSSHLSWGNQKWRAQSFSQKFSCTAGHIDFCNETSEQKFLYRSVQKISVKSRWNKLMSLKYDFQNLIFKIINLLSVRYFPHLNIAKWRNICVWIFMGFPLESMNWSCWTLTFFINFFTVVKRLPQVCTYLVFRFHYKQAYECQKTFVEDFKGPYLF